MPQATIPSTTAQANNGGMAERQIWRAKELEFERDQHIKQIGANREFLRLMAANGELSDEQFDWLEDFYPVKEQGERRNEDEIESTRKAKETARKEVTAARKAS